jgi:tetratricopeptide (TPR) repeat protein
VKVEALLRLNRYPEAVATALSVQVHGKPGSRLELIGRANHASGNLEAAERSFRDALEIVPNKPEVQYSLATVLFAPAVAYRNHNPGAAIPREVTDKLSTAGNLLESASATFRSQGRDVAALDVESALAIVRGLQDRHADSVRLIERIVRSSHATAHDWRNLGFSYLCINEPSKAVEALKNSIAQDLDSMTEFLYIQALTMSGKTDDALAFIESRATGPITADNVRWYVAKANVLGAKRQFSRAREVLTDVQQHSPTNAEVLLTIAEMYEATGNDTEAEPAYEEALKNATGNDETRVRYMFGGFASRRKDFARAVELWKPLIRSDRPDTLLDSYLCALYNSGNLSEVTSISVEARKVQAKVSEVVADVAAAAYQRLEDLKESESWLEYLCDTYGNKPRYIVRLSSIKFRLGRRDEATELLNASKSTLKDADELMGYAKAYSALGNHGDALELAHRAVLLESSPDIHMGYTGIFLAAGENVERTPEQISTFQDVLSKFNERFPDSLLLRSFKIDPDRPLDAIRDTLIKDSEQTRDAVKAYQNNQMPLYLFARLLGRDLYEVWFQIVSDPDLCLLTAVGTDDEQQEFQRLLGNATGFILDPVALFTFSFLGLIEELQILGDVYIAQSVLDHLHELLAARALLQRQRGRMGIVDGQFFMHESTTDELDKINSALRTATEWSETHAKTAGLKEPFTSDDTRWDKVLGSSNIATIVIAKQRGYVVVTDDKTLGDVGKQNYGTSFVNSQAVLLYLFNKGLIAKDAYDRAVLKLVEAGYVVTRIDGNQLFRVIVDEAFQVTPRLKRVLRVLEPASIALPQACAAVAGILRLIYLEPIAEDMRNQLTFQILDTLATNHPKMDVQRLVRAFLRQQMTPLLVLQLGVIEQLLDRW